VVTCHVDAGQLQEWRLVLGRFTALWGSLQKSALVHASQTQTGHEGLRSGTKLGEKTMAEQSKVDEAFFAPKPKNMHKDKRERYQRENASPTGGTKKTIVLGLLDRETKEIRAQRHPRCKAETLQEQIFKNVKVWLGCLYRQCCAI